ncbi:MAG TPA: enoyl-CoA hydratase-related protein [Pseudonocardia sp.]|jgi:enoyl-CoA hydratase/carnithine racemase
MTSTAITDDISTRYVRVEVERGVALLTVDRPPANALDLDLVRELSAVVATAGARTDVGAIVITGAGPRFVAGADIKMMRQLDPSRFPEFISGIQRAMDDIEAVPVPTIAAVNGHAMGGGMELALACDMRFLAEGAKLGLPEVKLGLLPGAGGTVRLTELVGKGIAIELLLTGRPVEAEEALRLRLINRVLPADQLVAEAVEYAAGLAAGPREAIAALKASVLAELDGGRRAGFRTEAALVSRLFASEDAREGIAAFVEKRPAVYRSGR